MLFTAGLFTAGLFTAGGYGPKFHAGEQMTAPRDAAVADSQRTIAALRRQLDERTAERDEALERETATAEVLQVINASPGNLAPVFDAMLEKAMRLCEAAFGVLFRYEGVSMHLAASRGAPVEAVEAFREWVPQPGDSAHELARGAAMVHIADVIDTEGFRAGVATRVKMIETTGVRTALWVALRKDDTLVGMFVLYRREVRPFSDKQVVLLENFAAQAVIAMENARLITETREALEQQTATAEVLQVINSSPGDLVPVFDAMLEKAVQLSTANFGILWRFEDGLMRLTAAYNVPAAFVEFHREPMRATPSSGPGRLMSGEPGFAVANLLEFPPYVAGDEIVQAIVDLAGARSLVTAPLRKDGMALGAITVYRQEVRPFSDKQFALLQNFAAQAVIAMENARLITETREALEQQTATAEVLQVINSSPGDLAPVFDAMLEKAHTLCAAEQGSLVTYDGEHFRLVANHGMPKWFAEQLRRPYRAAPGSSQDRLLRGEPFVQVADVRANPTSPQNLASIKAGSRTILMVPLRKDGVLLGFITAVRGEVRPFTDKQIALLQNFAAQAVIAMENARLLGELRDSTERHALVSQAVAEGIYDWDMVRNALWVSPRLIELFGWEEAGPGAGDRPSQDWNNQVHPDDFESYRGALRASLRGETARLQCEYRIRLSGGEYRWVEDHALPVRDEHGRAVRLVGAVTDVTERKRREQELREALDQQIATAEVLQVINSSPGNLAPVFDAMLERAVQLCEAQTGHLIRYENGEFSRAASSGVPEGFDEIFPRDQPLVGVVTRDSVPFRTLATRSAVHILDLREDESYRAGAPAEVAAVEQAGIRSVLFVPLLREGEVIGNFVMHRLEVRPFSDKQIALLENFSAQAVIAIENARLLTETREALEKQTATAEILRVISSSPTDVQPTFDAIAAAATTLCGATSGGVFRFDGSLIHFVAHYGWTADELDAVHSVFPLPPGRSSVTARAILTREVAHIADVAADPEFAHPSLFQAGIGTTLSIPMLRDGNPLGAITVTRHQVEPFSEAQIELLKTFADQAVIAIENVRLFNELRDRTGDLQESLEYQTATSDVLKVISRSTFDLQPVLDTLVQTATRLCDAEVGHLAIRQGDAYRYVATLATEPAWDAAVRARTFTPGRGTMAGRTVLERGVVHIADIAADTEYDMPEAVTLGKLRTMLGVPMLREGAPIGVITLGRQRVEPFTKRQIELVRTFADQAVIAIENARLIAETREALEQQTATAEVLQVINLSPGDLAPVFEAILEKAHALCGVESGGLVTYDGEYFRLVANHAMPERHAEYVRQPYRATPGSAQDRLLRGERFVHIEDVRVNPSSPQNLSAIAAGTRTLLFVPLRKEGALLGFITSIRREVRPFSEKEIALLENFAAQAVIAMENARLITETREALDQQTATAEVLQVINSSPGDLAPVFEAMLEKAMRLCEAAFGLLMTYDGEDFRATAQRGLPPRFAEYVDKNPTAWRGAHKRLAEGAPLVHLIDAKDDPSYPKVPSRRALVDLGGARTLLLVPLRQDERLLGSFAIYRQEVRAFTDKQIALLQNFAAQAVIAMENARLITETREALERQTATSDILRAIAAAPGDAEGTLYKIAETTSRLFAASGVAFRIAEGDEFKLAIGVGRGAEQLNAAFYGPTAPRLSVRSQALPSTVIRENRQIHIPDLDNIPAEMAAWPGPPVLRAAGVRTIVGTPLRREGGAVGALNVYRDELRPFVAKELDLLQSFADQAVIAIENARLITETREALDQQTATAEVLGVINSSPGDLAPVFEAILEKALSLCAATYRSLQLYDGDKFRAVAVHGLPESLADRLREGYSPGPNNPMRGLLEGEPFVHVVDMAEIDDPVARRVVELGAVRTLLSVALRKDDMLLGQIVSARKEVRPFAEKEIALLQNFAAQAVIAIENARLLGELRTRTVDLQESLEYQTATSDVLKVISRSTFDLQPVLDTLVETAARLCGADMAVIIRPEGDIYRPVAAFALSPESAAFQRSLRIVPGRGNTAGRALLERRVVHIADIAADPEHTLPGAVTISNFRTTLGVPLLREDVPVGVIVLARSRVAPFSERQIELVRTFADQAVIAIENARLITETREALDQQTATAEVLQVINSSPGDLAPVFDAILEKAHTLCDAPCGSLQIYDGEQFRAVATRGLPEPFAEILRQGFRIDANDPSMVNPDRVVQIADGAETVAHLAPDNVTRLGVELAGTRTALFVPLHKDNVFLGRIVAVRQEVRPFSDKEIALLQNFAAQAVIAMENARLLGELRARTGDLQESLEYQTATSDVLKVISRSTFDLQPVLDTLVETAARLCDAEMVHTFRREGELWRLAANFGFPPEYVVHWQKLGAVPRDPESPLVGWRAVGEGRPVHIHDAAAVPGYPEAAIRQGKSRTVLGVPLLREGEAIGVIVLARQRVEPFTDRQIELVSTFADQAVIAIENARLITETREALEQQTATAEVLGVINSSPGDLAPVFDAMLEKARVLCGFGHGSLSIYDGEYFRCVAMHAVPEPFAEVLRRPYRAPPSSSHQRLLDGERVVQFADIRTREISPENHVLRAAVEVGIRTVLFVPLRKDGALLGYINAFRQEVRPFTDKQIALLQNFAAQAVIAIENARLLGELRSRTVDLQESLGYQTATSDVLQVISRSTFDLQPVFDTLMASAARLCRAEMVGIAIRRDDGFHYVATSSITPEFDTFIRTRPFLPGRETMAGRVALEGRIIQIADTTADPEYRLPEVFTLGNIRTLLGVPLLREGQTVGVISLCRQRVEPFSERQIELVRTFADQAVIAIENTRLLTELRESLEQQQAIAEILQVINASPGELQPVFDILLDKAMQLCGAAFGMMVITDGDKAPTVAARGVPAAFAEFRRHNPVRGTMGSLFARLLAGESFVHTVDVKDHDLYRRGDPQRRAMVDLGGIRTSLIVALKRDRDVLGAIQIYRQEVRPFSDRQIALLQNFAAQAVIAMDNARLLDEIRQRQAELRVTFDNMADGVAMFDAELRLAAWNRNFQELLDVPDAFLAERPLYTDYVRYLAERGEFGAIDIEAELKRYAENVGRQWSAERTRPDGGVIEVRHNPVPSGGFVLIYADITERKRSEEQIRAARDTAQSALRELKAAQANLIQAEKMASLGQLTAGIAHEIKNPLNFVNNFANLSVELLDELKEAAAPAWATLGDGKREEIDEVVDMLTGNLTKIAEHGRRADGIVKSMLEHSRGGTGERRSVDLNGLVEEALNLAYHGARAQDQSFNITLERDFGAAIAPIELVPQDVTRVFLNLFGNGFYAANKRHREGSDPKFTPVLTVATRDLGAAVEVRVRDNGIGIPPELRDKLFQPFFTTKPTGEGTGLGLSISYDIVTQQHGGTIAIDSRIGEFTEFTIRLPRDRQAASTGAAA